MWGVIGTILTTALPLLLKLITYIVEKKSTSDKLKRDMLEFIDGVEKDLPVKLGDKYRKQLDRLRGEINEDKHEGVKPINPSEF